MTSAGTAGLTCGTAALWFLLKFRIWNLDHCTDCRIIMIHRMQQCERFSAKVLGHSRPTVLWARSTTSPLLEMTYSLHETTLQQQILFEGNVTPAEFSFFNIITKCSLMKYPKWWYWMYQENVMHFRMNLFHNRHLSCKKSTRVTKNINDGSVPLSVPVSKGSEPACVLPTPWNLLT